MLSRLSYFINEGFQNIFKSKIEALSSITTISMCIFVIGIMFMTFTDINYTIEKIQDDMNIIAFLDSSTSTGNAEALKKHILTNEHVTEITFVSKEEALINFSKKIANGDNLLQQYKDDNPLRDSLNIKIDKQENIEDVANMLKDSSFVKNIVKPTAAAKFLTQMSNVVKIISFVFIIILVGMSVILIINTIKLTVYIRRNDIQIMKYVGATNAFVRTPFIIEGILIGLIGTIVPLIILYIIYSIIYDNMTGNVSSAFNKILALKTAKEMYNVLIPLCSIIGIGIGTTGSIISIRKYLNV